MPPLTLAGTLRWTARFSGLIVAVGYAAVVAAHILEPHSAPPAALREWIGIVLLSLACLMLIVAWRWELLGGLLSLGALAAFVVVIRIQQPLVIGVIAAPAILYLATWLAGSPRDRS